MTQENKNETGSVESKTSIIIKDLIASRLNVERSAVVDSAHLATDLGGDSLDIAELIIAIEEEFDCDVSDEHMEEIKTVGDAIKYVEEKTKINA